MGSGCSSEACCYGVCQSDGLYDTFNTYALQNMTISQVSFAVYYKKLGFNSDEVDVRRCTEVIVVNPAERLLVTKPKLRLGYARIGVVMRDDDPPNTLDAVIPMARWKPEYEELNGGHPPHVLDLELQHACVIYEARKCDGAPLVLHITTPTGYVAYKLTRPIVNALDGAEEAIEQALRHEFVSKRDPNSYRYAKQVARVRYSHELCHDEATFLSKRLPVVRAALGKFLDMDLSSLPLSKIPKIGVACSGGGYRAALASLGVFAEMESQGLLDCVTFTSGLSGGAWLLTHVYGSGAKTIAEVRAQLRDKLAKPFFTSAIFPESARKELAERLLQENDLCVVDTYSWYLHHHMFDNFPSKPDLWDMPRLSEQVDTVANGERPLPIYSAVTAIDHGSYRWVEFTPYECGLMEDVNSFIPSWSFGRKFKDGVSEDGYAEPTLGFFAAVAGSAFCATIDQIAYNTIDNDTTLKIMEFFLHKEFPTLGEDRVIPPARYWNPFDKGGLSRLDKFAVFDAGCDINIPFAPLIRREREVDILIALDQSGGRDQIYSTNLELAAKYAKERNLPFPDVSAAIAMEKKLHSSKGSSMSAASTHPLTVCKGSLAKRIPTVMYMSLLRNEKYDPQFDPRTADFCATGNWVYDNEQFDKLTGLTQFNTRQVMDQIKAVLKETVTKLLKSTRGKTEPVAPMLPSPEGSGSFDKI